MNDEFYIDYNAPFHKIGEEILKLFSQCQDSANDNNDIGLVNCIQEYIFKSKYSEEEILDVLEDDDIFKNILHNECLKHNYIKDETYSLKEDITDIKLWEM